MKSKKELADKTLDSVERRMEKARGQEATEVQEVLRDKIVYSDLKSEKTLRNSQRKLRNFEKTEKLGKL